MNLFEQALLVNACFSLYFQLNANNREKNAFIFKYFWLYLCITNRGGFPTYEN